MKLFLFALLLVSLFAAYRLWVASARRRFIEAFRLPGSVQERMKLKHPELSEAQHALVQQGLQQYFRICASAKGRFVSMPSQVVDDLWHEFILFTRLYQNFCERALGRYLHHTPAEAMTASSAATEGIRRAWRLACREEGINPNKPERLPLLFALDAQLGVAGGFVYVLNCQDTAYSSSGSFCASDIGDGSSDSGSDDGSSDGGGCDSGCGGDGD
ncbi:MAG TPA: hypothetical protein VFR06_06760 [Gallionellaceae bacterium]|nr:hypothetical protein [Gallionellaceae bacterium]